MTNFAKAVGVLVLSLATSAALGQASMSVENNRPQLPVLGLPYSADQKIRTVQHLANGITVTHEVAGRIYRSSTGLERVEGTPTAGDEANPYPVTLAWIVDRAQSTVVMVHVQSKFATITHLPANSTVTVTFLARTGGQKRPGKVETTDLGRRTLDGLVLAGQRNVRTIPFAGVGNDAPFVSTREIWVDPELKLLVSEIENDPIEGERTVEVTNVRREEPDADLFRIPDGFKVVDQPLAGAGQAGRTSAP